MATGGHIARLDEEVAASRKDLLIDLHNISGLSAQQVDTLLMEYDALAVHVNTALRIKMNYMTCLPHALAGLAHRCEAKAKFLKKRITLLRIHNKH